MSALWLGWMWLAACGGDDSPGDGPSSVGESASTATTADTADTDDTDDTTPTPTETSVEALLVALSNRGIDANEGHISFTAADDCCAWDTCLHINPGAEYATYALPPGPGEYIGDRNPDELGRILSWRLREDEAVIYVGPPPPGTAYTSFRTYIHDVAAVGGGRAMSFANLGDSLNQLVWDVNPDGTLIVVTTANQETLDRVRDAAAAVGWPVVAAVLVLVLVDPSPHRPPWARAPQQRWCTSSLRVESVCVVRAWSSLLCVTALQSVRPAPMDGLWALFCFQVDALSI